MRTLFLVCILMIGMQLHSFGQEIFIKTGINSTTYDFRSADGTKLLDFTSGMGNSIEMGMGFPFVPKSKRGLRNFTKHNFTNNCKFEVDIENKKVKVYSIIDIHPGSELFISYGSDYWS